MIRSKVIISETGDGDKKNGTERDSKKTLTVKTRCDIIFELSRTACGLVAQLDRVFDYESKGRGFESRRAHHERSTEKCFFSLYFNVLSDLEENAKLTGLYMFKVLHDCLTRKNTR